MLSTRRALFGLLVLTVVSSAPAQDAPARKSPLGEPIGILNVAGIDRILADIRWTFASAERDDVYATVETVLSVVNDLEGLDRTRPFGAMAFAAPGGNGQPLVVGYVPVTDLDKAMASLRVGPIRPERVEGTEGRWKFANPDGGGRALYVGEQDGYAFLVAEAAQLDVVMPRPDRIAKSLTERHDVAASLNLDGVPAGLRFIAAAGLQAAASAEQERKPGESDTEFANRKKVIAGGLALARRILNEGRDAVVGFSFDEERKRIALEWSAHARPGTQLAADLEAVRGRDTPLDRAASPKAPMSIDVSLPVPEESAAFARELLDQARDQVGDAVRPNLGLDFAKGILATGGVDLLVTTAGGPPRGLSSVLAIRVKDAEALAGRLRELAEQEQLDPGTDFEPNAFEHRGARFFAIRPPGMKEPDAERLFGKEARIDIGASGDVLWLGVGGNEAVGSLKSAIDRVAESSSESDSPSEPKPVFDLQLSASTLLLLGEERDREFEAIAQRAFLAGGDRLRFTIGPETNGVAARLTAKDGFVRLLGLGAARAFDEAQ